MKNLAGEGILPSLRWAAREMLVAACVAIAAAGVLAAEGGPGENADVEIGGPGSEAGKFLEVRDLLFGPDNRLYVLEGRRRDQQANRWVGNCRVQIFDAEGTYRQQFPIAAEGLSDAKDPARIAVTARGDVLISEPSTGVVLQYRGGKPVHSYPIPGAYALAVWGRGGSERVAVIARRYEQNTWVPFDRVEVIDPGKASLGQPLKLSRGLAGVMDLAADPAGNLYAVAEVNQLYKFNPSGQLLAVVGAGTWRRTADGSELRHTVALDPAGGIYSQAWGKIARFAPDLKSVTLKTGEFYWYDNWSPHDAYTPFAIDRNGRFWLAATGNVAPDQRHHYRPCVSRVVESFFQGTKPQSTLALGFDPQVVTGLPYHIAYELAPIELEFVVQQAFRQVHDVVVDYRVYDVYKREVAKGSFALKLEDGVEARRPFRFTPPRYGWYTVECGTRTRSGQAVFAVGTHLGVTPSYPGMPALAEGDSPGGWVDPPRHAFCGLRLMRVHTAQGEETIEKALEQARKLGVTLLVQFQDKQHCAPDQVRQFVSKFKGRVKYWEIVNEPNFSMQPDEYARLLGQVHPLIKQLDPNAQVIGPAVCGINLGWHEAVFAAGGARYLDAVSIHDYEGNESIDPGHWRWKIARLRELMDKHGLGNRSIWQTERAIGGVRANNFLGGVQAIRVSLQRDLMESLGVPNERNLHYYMNQAGYGAVPTYLWSASGPHPAALLQRTREAMVGGRRYAGTLDFGPGGNQIFLALRYRGGDGTTVVLRQLGAAEDPTLELPVTGGSALEVVDSFGNRQTVPVRNGKVSLKVPLLPLFLRLQKNQEIAAPAIDFGRNLAPDATLSYSGKTTSEPGILTNGLFEVTHAGSPWGPYWAGDLSSGPQHLEIAFSQPRPVDRVLVYSMRADNPHCYLVDFDLQFHDGRQWKTLREVRTPLPPSDPVRTAESRANTWYLDQNFALVEFRPVTTDRLRIVARRSTLGFHPDATAVEATGWQAGGPNLHLREIEVYGPPPPVKVTARLSEPEKPAAFQQEPVDLTVTNRTTRSLEAVARLGVPEGWNAEPAEVPVTLAAGASRTATIQLLPPADIPTGRIPVDVVLEDRLGRPLDYRRLTLSVLPPVAVTPLPPPSLDDGQQPMAVEIKNLTDRPLGGVVRLTLSGDPGQELLEVEKPFPPVAPQGATRLELRVPGLNLSEAAWLARYRVTTDRLVTTAEQDFTTARLWQVLGPIPDPKEGGFDTVYPPEQHLDVSRPVTPPGSRQSLSWKPAMNNPAGFVDLTACFGPLEGACGYAAIYVKSPTARPALLSAGSDDGVKIWLNRRLVVSHNVTRGAQPGQEQEAVDLDAGWNEVLLKITQDHSGWGFYFDLLTPGGQPMTDLTYAPRRP